MPPGVLWVFWIEDKAQGSNVYKKNRIEMQIQLSWICEKTKTDWKIKCAPLHTCNSSCIYTPYLLETQLAESQIAKYE